MRKVIDINADLGEGIGNEDKLMPLISSCSIACGGHFGDERTMTETIRLAKKYNVKVGAHPSFPDKENFGRKIMTLSQPELADTVFQQIKSFEKVCAAEEVVMHHIKLHGALYNLSSVDAMTADAVLQAILVTKLKVNLYVPYNSILAKKAENFLPLIYEAFIDRRYEDDLNLVNRSQKNAIIHSAEEAWKQLYKMIIEEKVTTLSGLEKKIKATTFCVHSDHENTLDILKYIKEQMKSHAIFTS